MKIKRSMAFLAAICILLMLTACMNGQTGPSSSAGNPQMVQAFHEGVLVAKDEEGNRWLIAQYRTNSGEPVLDAIWFRLDEQTRLENFDGTTLSPADVQVGHRVEAWHSGPVAESYPAQAQAAKLRILPEQQNNPSDLISRQTAIRSAIDFARAATFWGVKAAVLDRERKIWSIELVDSKNPKTPVSLRIDAKNGQVIPQTTLENEAFRVFLPKPEMQTGSSISVSGEARVFEAGFSWLLEDGHHILAEGHAMADKGAPEWGRFNFTVNFEKATNPTIMLILFVASANDGRPQHQLVIPLKPQPELIDYGKK